MRFKMVALFLVLGLAASITACGGSEKTDIEDSTPKTEETLDEAVEGEEIPQTQSGSDIPEEIEETEEKAN